MTNLLLSFGSVMQTIGYIALAVLVLLLMITIHEFGHYVAGKIFGFGITEFAIGFGPADFQKEDEKRRVFLRALSPARRILFLYR